MRSFAFTGTQLNRDYQAAVHVDADSTGSSYIIGLGAYTCGELCHYDEKGDAEVTVERKMIGWSHAEGTALKGKLYNVHERWLPFDGLRPHAAMPFKSTRISLVYFTSRHAGKMPEFCRRKLTSDGFVLP